MSSSARNPESLKQESWAPNPESAFFVRKQGWVPCQKDQATASVVWAYYSLPYVDMAFMDQGSET